MTRIAVGLLAALSIASPGSAADLTGMYDPSTLRYWGERYPRSTRKILDEVIWPALLTEEKRRLGGKPALEFPRYAEYDASRYPLAFYARGDRASIVFPLFSLKFLDDLCTAYAWLEVRGYSLETVSEYTAILSYGEPPAGGFPSPLEALGIPEDALADREVDELALGHFVTARTFLLLHEMGHLLYRHRALSLARSVQNEREADRFAAEVMPRTRLPPLGMLVFFMADAHWSAFPASGPHTHPLSGERVRALADHLEDPDLARRMRDLGALLDDPEIRAGFLATGKAGDLAALAPRRPGDLPRRRTGKASATSPAPVDRAPLDRALFDGVYQGDLVQYLAPRPMAVELVLERHGDDVTGRYSFGLGFGRIEGRARGKVLHYDWRWSGNFGRGVLEDQDGRITGTWGYQGNESGAGTWRGQRVSSSGAGASDPR